MVHQSFIDFVNEEPKKKIRLARKEKINKGKEKRKAKLRAKNKAAIPKGHKKVGKAKVKYSK